MMTALRRAMPRVAACILLLLAGGIARSDPPEAPRSRETDSAAVFTKAAVAADHPAASAAGLEILQAGGNAVDAAVAVSFTLSVVRPESCGIGGGGFMVIHLNADPRYGTLSTAINYREQCPRAIDRDFYTRPENLGEDVTTHGAKAVAVPGTVAGLLYALEKYGTLDRGKVLEPAIRAARDGFIADDHTVASAMEVARWLVKQTGRRDRFRFVWKRLCRGSELRAGDRITLPEQARALELIADRGAGAFYYGEIARAIVSTVSADDGVIGLADLGAYRVEEVDPLTVRFAGRTLLCMPPPSSGGLALAQTVGILERLPSPLAVHPVGSVESVHLIAEAMKHAFADRARWLGDPAFVNVPVDRLLSNSYLSDRAAQVRPDACLPLASYGTGPDGQADAVTDGGTSHFSLIDERGNAVACTETINLTFGSLLAVEEFGFILNNQMDDFLTRPGEANAFGLTQSRRNLPDPGKRPLSSMSPTIALSTTGEVELVAGASGGPRIISATAQAVIRAFIYGTTAADATGLPRLHTQWMPDTLWLEDGLLDKDQREALSKLGHHVSDKAPSAACQVILRRDGRIEAACDPRKGGKPAGY